MSPIDNESPAESGQRQADTQVSRPQALEGRDGSDTEMLRPALAAVVEDLGDRFDSVRFRFIQSLAEAALRQRPAVAEVLEQKALQALSSYMDDYRLAQQDATELVEKLVAEKPEAAEGIQQLFKAGDFAALQRMATHVSTAGADNPDTLGGLNRDLLRRADISEPSAPTTLEDELRLQELRVMHSIAGTPNSSGDSSATRSGAGSFDELSVMHRFRQSLRKHNSHQRLSLAIQDGPENPGPLNAQALVVRTLSTMRGLSPSYADRFLSYMDTLLWLERAAKADEPAKKKTKGRRRS